MENKPKISLIVAMGKNREIGRDNKLLIRIPEDLKRFKALTMGHAVIMGRKTYQSIGHALPGRTNIVLTHEKDNYFIGCSICWSLSDALIKARQIEKEEIFIIGGGEVFRQSMQYADKLYITIVDQGFEADTYFPEYPDFTKVTDVGGGEYKGVKYRFLELEK